MLGDLTKNEEQKLQCSSTTPEASGETSESNLLLNPCEYVSPESSASLSVPEHDVSELKGNFEQQQAMIGQLRDILRQKESSKRQEKEIEDYATRLAKMKPRLIKGKGRGRVRDRDDSTHKRGSEPSRKDLNLLSETGACSLELIDIAVDSTSKLDLEITPPLSNTVAFHQSPPHSPLSPLEVSVPLQTSTTSQSTATTQLLSLPQTPQESGHRAKILLLRKQLEENRLKFERQQRENFEKKAVMEDMKERIEKLRSEVEQRDTVILSLQDVDSSHYSDPNVQHLYQQILHKDSTVLELSDRVNQLESIIQDQKEQLEEKDQVISARTEAVSLIAKDRDEKIMKTMQELDELRYTMREMQASFTYKEEQWKDEQISLTSTLVDKNKKISALEENCHRIESIRFELSTRNAELQEKIIALQCDSNELRKVVEETKAVNFERTEEINDIKRKLVRAESFGQKKLKALEKQIRSITGEANMGEQIVELQNQIAELEEEKGNLQLKLVDFDELKCLNEKHNSSVKSLEIKLDQLSSEVFSQMNVISKLDNEKIKLIEQLNSKNLTVNSLEETMSKYQFEYEDVKQSKVTLELRLCALEEERDLAIKTQKDLENEQKKIDPLAISEMQKKNDKLEQKINTLLGEVEEKNMKVSEMENTVFEKDNLLKVALENQEQKTDENNCLISMLAEKESIITSQSIKIDKHDLVVEQLQSEMSSKDNENRIMTSKIKELSEENAALIQKLIQSESTVLHLQEKAQHLQDEVETNHSNILALKEVNENLNLVLLEKKKSIQLLDGEICSLQEELRKKESFVMDQMQRLEILDDLLQSRENELEKLDANYNLASREKSLHENVSKKLEQDLENMKKCLQETESRLTAECDAISCLLLDKNNQVKSVEELINVKKTELKNSEIIISRYEQELCDKNRLYDNLLEEKETLVKRLADLEVKLKEFKATIESKSNDQARAEETLDQKEMVINHLKAENASYVEMLQSRDEVIYNLEYQKKTLESKNSELHSMVEVKENEAQQLKAELTLLVSKKEEELSELQTSISEKEFEMNNLKESFLSHSGEASHKLEQTQEQLGKQLEKYQSQATVKEEELKHLQQQNDTLNQYIQQVNMDLSNSQNEIQYYKKQIEEIWQRLEQSGNDVKETKFLLESSEANQVEKENEIEKLKGKIEDQNIFIQSLQSSTEILSMQGQEVNQLHHSLKNIEEQLHEKSRQLHQAKEQHESELKNETSKYESIVAELSKFKTEIEGRDNEILLLKSLSEELNQKLKNYEEFNLSSNEKENYIILEMQNQLKENKEDILKLQDCKMQLEQELQKLMHQLNEENVDRNNLHSQVESLSQQIFSKNEEIAYLKSKLSVSLDQEIAASSKLQTQDSQDSSYKSAEKELKDKNSLLEKQLEEAQQAIIRLETMLATQSGQGTQDGSDDWGIVDLGEPSINGSSLSIQATLMEKDKALTVIQEQLKNALEQVNTTTDEKKIIQHQMNTLEAELSHKDNKILGLEKEISDLKGELSSLSQGKEFSSPNEVHQEETVPPYVKFEPKVSSSQQAIDSATLHSVFADSKACKVFSIESSDDSHNQSAPDAVTTNWFKSSSGDFFDTITPSAPIFQEQKEKYVEGKIPEQETLPDQFISDSNQITEQVQSLEPELNLEELQYKVSWYEENWAAWTEQYNQLQISYQTAEQQIMVLNVQLDALKQNSESTETSQLSYIQKDQDDLKSKFEDLERSCNILKDEKQRLEENIQQMQIDKENELETLKLQSQQHLEVNQELDRLRCFETQVYELQGQLQTMHHQHSMLETKINETEIDSSKLKQYEFLYGELQSYMQESETKREGSKSRVQELELMVQSAESEIARLRLEIQTRTGAEEALEREKCALQEEIGSLKEESRKSSEERERFEKENDRIQTEAASLHSQMLEIQTLLQRQQSENEQLKSEVELLEGENDRMRSNCEIYESESNRLRSENELLTQTNQIVLAEKESLETEVSRLQTSVTALTLEKDHFTGEMQRITEVTTSAESEINRLNIELNNSSSINDQYENLERKYLGLQNRLVQMENEKQKTEPVSDNQDFQLEEVDWSTEAKIEDEHIQRSSSVEKVLHEEVSHLKEKVIALERERNEIYDELQASKLKNGKMIQKLKAINNKHENLLKEMEKLKLKAGGFSDLDLALEEEWKTQVAKVENERDELKIKLDEMEKEKDQLLNRLEVFENAHDKYIEMKENQDASLRQLTARNKDLESQVSSLEWKISEMEDTFEEQKLTSLPHLQREELAAASSSSSSSPHTDYYITEIQQLKLKVATLENNIVESSAENAEIKKSGKELESKIEILSKDNEELQTLLEDMRDAKSKAETNMNTYKTSYLEIYTEQETLQENLTKASKELEEIKYQHLTLKAAYDVLYEEYHQLQDSRDGFKYDIGILIGERDKLQEEVNSLNNQLQALQEEEEEEVIRALQFECSDLREQNNELKDEVTQLGESVRTAEESAERTKHSLDQQIEIQELLRTELAVKSQHNDLYADAIAKEERQNKYLTAEIAAYKTKSSQQQQAVEEQELKLNDLKEKLAHAQEDNKQLKMQVVGADDSLIKLVTQQPGSESKEEDHLVKTFPYVGSELEAALSSLHLRDLRCQQLSFEINKLLEERDSLQLKLSAALRQNQDLSRELSLSQQLPAPSTPPPSLSQKLAELRDLNSSLEQKTLESLRGGTIGTHFSSMPPSLPTFVSHTAPATPTATRHTDYVVTRENQGTSSTLMNWFLGKSTPKEVLHV